MTVHVIFSVSIDDDALILVAMNLILSLSHGNDRSPRHKFFFFYKSNKRTNEVENDILWVQIGEIVTPKEEGGNGVFMKKKIAQKLLNRLIHTSTC